MEETLELLIAGKISPVHPIAEYCITDTEQAFRYMSAGTHTGKIVITAKPEASHDELVKVKTLPFIYFFCYIYILYKKRTNFQ